MTVHEYRVWEARLCTAETVEEYETIMEAFNTALHEVTK